MSSKPARTARFAGASARRAVSLISLLLVAGTFLPESVDAGVFSTFIATLKGKQSQAVVVSGSGNLQTMAILKPAMNINPAPAVGGGDITIVDDSALLPEEGPVGTIADIEKPKNGTISTHVVRQGDTISGIAKMFDVKASTILWANDLSSASKLKVGQVLTILPVTGVKHTIKKGDTLASIAKLYNGDATEIASYNGLDDQGLTIGDEIIIPNGEVSAPAPPTTSKPKSGVASSTNTPKGTATQIGYYLRPIVGGVRTQGIHGYNGVDLASPVGTAILASATGNVIVAKEGGWNGGYGSYVVIQHDNGSQTLYSHASDVAVSVGEHVLQGQVIAHVGRSGKATGAHVHFEIRNGIRNPF